MKIERVGDRWICKANFRDSHIPREAGFRCDPKPGPNGERIWFTTDQTIAAKIMMPADAAALEQQTSAAYGNLLESIAETSDFVVPTPRPSLQLKNYQRAGVSVLYKRPANLLADDQGLGKTIQVAGLINCLTADLRKILVICPNGLQLNWLQEMQTWCIRKWHVAIWNTEVCRPSYVEASIIHYEAVVKWADVLKTIAWDLVAIDECHLLKNGSSLRARAILGLDVRTAKREEAKRLLKLHQLERMQAPIPARLLKPIVPIPPLRGKRAVCMTGTPLPNRPKEVWPIAHYLDPVTFKSNSKFKQQFCGWSADGAYGDDNGGTNLTELQLLLRSTIMVRRLKKDVLKELPAKRRMVIEIPHDQHAVIDAELAAFKASEDDIIVARQAIAAAKGNAEADPVGYAAAVQKLKGATVAQFSQISRQRHDTAIAKLPYIIDRLRTLVHDEGDKLIVFAHHHEVIEAIVKEFGARCVTCYGPDSLAERQANVTRFQTDPTCSVIAGTYKPMGTGWTLTASSHVIVAELDWVPGNMNQAEDRAHRIGQTDMVLVEHLVLQGSLEAHMARRVVEKQEVQAAALDMEIPPEVINARDNLAAAGQEQPAAPAPARTDPTDDDGLLGAENPTLPVPMGEYSQLSFFEGEM